MSTVIMKHPESLTTCATERSPSPSPLSLSSSSSSSWNEFLSGPAISYVPPRQSPSTSSDPQSCQCDGYWDEELLHQWRQLLLLRDGEHTSSSSLSRRVQHLTYGSLLLLASSLAEKILSRLALMPNPSTAPHGGNCNSVRIGMALPEGPFLPLFVLAIHSLNLAVAEDWLVLAPLDDAKFERRFEHCRGVVFVPMESDEAPDRLRHILWDSRPDIVVVAPGKEGERMELALRDLGSLPWREEVEEVAEGRSDERVRSFHTELIDVTQLVREALHSLQSLPSPSTCNNQHSSSLIDDIFPLRARDHCIDSLRYPHAIPHTWDVSRLVAIGALRLATSFSFLPPPTTNHPSKSSPNEIQSHIVYTSGTTGKPKGCLSSLSSLQHYIRAKNRAHGILRPNHSDGRPSTMAMTTTEIRTVVLLASAITFDPCFSDVLATLVANVTLGLTTRKRLYGHDTTYDDESGDDATTTFGIDPQNKDKNNYIRQCHDDPRVPYGGLTQLLRTLRVTHVLCTPTLWSTAEGKPPQNVPSLRTVALGGEPIPKAMVATWARRRVDLGDTNTASSSSSWNREYPRLLATYGVTEACVYQTCGEVVYEVDDEDDVAKKPGNCVGWPLWGTSVHICKPLPEEEADAMASNVSSPALEKMDPCSDASHPKNVGEVVLSGAQLDAMSSYWNLPDLTKKVFVHCNNGKDAGLGHDAYFYRTGDLGYIDDADGTLRILGRIKGDGMVKINGIRIELAEIESAVIDDVSEQNLIVDCMAAAVENSRSDGDLRKQIVAYCILSAAGIAQLDISSESLRSGMIVPRSPLLSLLRARCNKRVRKGCIPSFFVLIDRFPLSPTGKRNRSALPSLENCAIMGKSSNEDDGDRGENTSLWKYGDSGAVLADKICECLNLHPCQRQLVASKSNFFLLGGDSLAATRVTRGLYALHHGITDSRNLGGSTGTLDGPFAAKYLLRSKTLGDYVEFLDSHSIFSSVHRESLEGNEAAHASTSHIESSLKEALVSNEEKDTDPMYESLIEAITLGQTSVAVSLLDVGVDPNSLQSKGRLGKVTDRKKQRNMFNSNPLHLACVRGNNTLVKKLLQKGCKANTPDAAGSFPIHLACSSNDPIASASLSPRDEDLRRLECVKLLLDAGTPISIKDGNKQTLLHSAARSGHCEVLKFIMKQWKIAVETTGLKFRSCDNSSNDRIYDWYDRWFRTPVHWAILNKRTEALRVLIDGGGSAFPSKPKTSVSARRTSVEIESPMEMCVRLYGDSEGVGKDIRDILSRAKF